MWRHQGVRPLILSLLMRKNIRRTNDILYGGSLFRPAGETKIHREINRQPNNGMVKYARRTNVGCPQAIQEGVAAAFACGSEDLKCAAGVSPIDIAKERNNARK